MVLEADNSFKELAHIKKQNRAENGGHGQKKNCSGKNAPDLNIKVGEKCQRLLLLSMCVFLFIVSNYSCKRS